MKDGGPAFPAVIPIEHVPEQGKDYLNYTEAGMTLRDYFAAKVMQGILAHYGDEGNSAELASMSYRFADAMLAARAAKEER